MSQPARPLGVRSDQPPLVATKIFMPRAREGLVSRPQLMGRLDDGATRALTLVSAPAGFGKTTLLAEWLRWHPHRACWLSLDSADNDPARFLSYVIAALQTAVPGLAGDLANLLRSPEPPGVETVVATLVNELASVPDHVTLVLDDFHVVTSPAVSSALTFLVEGLPPSVHLVISTRSDPAIPIARLRARGQVVEVRADDLRFASDEAAAFLGQTMGLALSAEQVEALEERTEGWIAGLQMAALSMRGRADVDSFIRAFAGTNRFVLDFLVEEVLSREPEEVQTFLLHTAILTRLSGPLCDAVTGTAGGQEMLERLERRNLFVVSLDDDRRWYRYHHLFADLLRARLQQSGSDAVARLYSRAAEWCEGDGQFAEAVSYALAAKDVGRAAGLIARLWSYTVSTGQVETVHSWLNALPEDVVRGSAPLSVAYCWVLWLKGQVGLVEPRLEDAERAMAEWEAAAQPSADDALYVGAPALIAALRSIVARFHGELEAAVTSAELALRLMPENLPPETDAALRSVLWLSLATAYDGAGDFEKAVDAYAETLRLSRLGKSGTGIAGATYWLTGLLRLLGRLRRADEVCQETLRFAEEEGMGRLSATGLLHVVMGELLLERNELEAAEAHLARGFELGRWAGRLDAVRNAAPALVRLRLARGDASGALAAVQEAEVAQGERMHGLVRAELLALRARILVWQGAVAEAAQCAQEAVRLASADRGRVGSVAALAASRALIAQRQEADAVALLTRSLADAERAGRLGSAIEMRVLRGLALARQGDLSAAEADLARALSLAEPEGYVRVFVDEGEPMADLLRRLARRSPRTGEGGAYSPEYVSRLLAAFSGPGEGPTATPAPQPGTTRRPALVEPLSERELEVLGLMADGLTNEQIASRLIIALGTVKAHIHNISGKLGAQNRARAVARAKELGLL